MKAKTTAADIPVVVTTEFRGVFFGYIPESAVNEDIIELKKGRNVLYWSADLRGFMGLASKGPNGSCKIGPSADVILRKITSVIKVTPEAEAKWNEIK